MSGPFLITTVSMHTAVCRACHQNLSDTNVDKVTRWMDGHACAGTR